MTGGFLMAVIAIALAIVIAAPQYAEPVAGAGDISIGPQDASPNVAVEPAEAVVVEEVMTSKPPNKLRGYRWPVRGGMVARYYEAHAKGDFQIDGERVHDGIIITWMSGATVKAAHKGTVVAAGRDWAEHVGFEGPLKKIYEGYAPIDDPKKARKSKKPWFPQGIVIDDGNGYYSVYSEIKDLLVKPGAVVKVGQPIASMTKSEKMVRYRLVRMDGPKMRVHQSARARGYPRYARERVDPLAVLSLEGNGIPDLRRKMPTNPPRLSEY
jgi:murein DD-endopeptidase MepM/ murein hydrolase activator NlpD